MNNGTWRRIICLLLESYGTKFWDVGTGRNIHVRFQVSTAVTKKIADFWDINPISYFTGDTVRLHYRVQPVNTM
jgi:hypothetical protein